ncbi:5-carboxymethyl-2-hydroxymuconateDelta-isomerase [Cellulomonas flavigena DSM 20109]|uniref:5-carboxymethyl-2-hydroxymuconateDelta-isomerase n=1 Tax=Cellulomonas flavigena (strain ATCC 482 / DSM 20109 / BCRC 11376 / JCM 18109 / NBRC 3775 / NCIMB 8073 / NRS 134) TaxID=446466 RepID=D5UH11_CELFN|nr:fumarylacetoacetate hydrolase family protein [Cellulomonas flavigena]ADG73214.1 5-carboxymethyl-2-hydroxymuconateDelta-isomerase [Cellulomonas flavigena DSM 20109]
MKLASTLDRRLLAVRGDHAVDLTDALGLTPGPGGPLLAFLERGGTLDGLLAIDLDALPAQPLDPARLAAPLARPGKVVGAPVNYRDHQVEMAEQRTIADYGVFLKATSSVIGPNEHVRLPYTDVRTDHEGELGVVIGRTATRVPPERALDHVLGYAPVLDITVRAGEDRSTRKSFDTFTPFGPWVTTADEVPDPGALELRCWVDDELRQHASTTDLLYDVAELIAYTSHVMTLHPGDVIATGTPAGVGPIAAGQRVAVEISGLGRLEVRVTDEGAIPYAERPGPR